MKSRNQSLINFLKGTYFKVDLALHFTLLVVIYTLMFNFVISKLIKKELFKVLDTYTNINDKVLNLNQEQQIILKKLSDNYKNIPNSNDLTYQHNRRLKLILYSIVSLIIVLFILLIYYYIVKKKLSMRQFKKIMLENVLLFIIVGIIEIIFTFNIATRYISINPSFLVEYFYETYNKYVE